MIENVRQSERDILEVIRDLDRQDDANTDTIDIIKSAEQFMSQMDQDKKGIIHRSMAPTTVALIRKAIKESGSRTGQAIWTYLKPQSMAFGGTVKYSEALSPQKALRSNSPQFIAGRGSPTPKYFQSSKQYGKVDSPVNWEETSINTFNQSLQEGFRPSMTPVPGQNRTGSPNKLIKKNGIKPPKVLQTNFKPFSRESINNRYVTPLSTIPRHAIKIKDEEVR